MNGLLFSVAVATTVLTTTSNGPEWSANYGKTREVARSAHRPLLVVLDQPKSEGPSQIKNHVTVAPFATDDSKAKLLKPYELCYIDVSSEYGKKVAKAFGATQFPYTAIIDNTASFIIYQRSGPLNEGDWASTLVAHQEGVDHSRAVKSDDQSLALNQSSDVDQAADATIESTTTAAPTTSYPATLPQTSGQTIFPNVIHPIPGFGSSPSGGGSSTCFT